jgi:glyceraldehyde 3-phosphate dehydrogenase
MTKITGINGFGRFGLHLLEYWLDRRADCGYRIDFINDDVLTLAQAFDSIQHDDYVRFERYRIAVEGDHLSITSQDGFRHKILYSHRPQDSIPWLGEPDIFFECSGMSTAKERCLPYLKDRTRLVLVSATSWDADDTLVFGFNHEAFTPAKHTVISYGSCTVNGYVPLGHYMNERYGVVDSDVNVVHNIAPYRLAGHDTLQRKFCTLEKSGPQLLPFLDPEKNYVVNYTVVPWTGASMIDFRFRLQRPVDQDTFLADLDRALGEGPLKGLYGMQVADVGPQAHVCTPYSAVFIREGIKVRGDQVYLQSYFDTENSVNRFHDLVEHICAKL